MVLLNTLKLKDTKIQGPPFLALKHSNMYVKSYVLYSIRSAHYDEENTHKEHI